jgi:AcrR family transcriptional regulator
MSPRQSSHEKKTPPDFDALPSWQRKSVERSLRSARDRARDRSDRLVNAGLELIKATGDLNFTVQDVADQAGMSIRTFYMFFATKDDLLLAIHERIFSTEASPRLRKSCDAVKDPVEKIRTFIEALFALAGNGQPATRALLMQQHRLAESRPDDLDRAMEPQVQLFITLLQQAADSDRLSKEIDIETTARLLHTLIHGLVESRVLGSKLAGEVEVDEVWTVCKRAIGIA